MLIGYTVDVIQDASAYAEHAGKNDIDEDDVKLAIQGRITHSFTAPPRQEVRCLFFNFLLSQFCKKKITNN